MAHVNFSGSPFGSISHKQCIIADNLHQQCLSEMKSENDYLCPDTLQAYRRWCPSDIRAQQAHFRYERHLSRETAKALSS
mmetsp:Transcript_25983/g.25573  ORF Transcript_25983/g.25573 Transcript_25983/m.25573 type:complete len:80 (-) Transcript_25983:32-271(-)